MTQPPQPSDQPSQEPSDRPSPQPGFGPPQDPAQPSAPGGPDLGKAPGPGYGYPQAPQSPPAAPPTPPTAPQPGYGHPGQQPPAGYGHPGQQPGPYGQPQPGPYGRPQQPDPYGQPGPYGPPGYGYAQAPTVPMHPQPGRPGGGRRFGAQAAIVVAAVAAIALIVGGGVWYASSGKDDDRNTSADSGGTGGTAGGKAGGGGGTTAGGEEKVPADPGSELLFRVPAPKVPKGTTTIGTSGSWVTDTVYAKSGIAEIVGYDRDKGTERWTIDLPGPVCEASGHVTEDNRTAIVYKPAMPTKNNPQPCTRVGVIDLEAGKELWSKSAKSGTMPISFNNVTLSGGTVAAGSTSGGAAWEIGSGKQLWAPKTSDSCYDAGYGGGEKLVAVRKCGSYDQRRLHVQTIDPKSGTVISEYKMDEGIEYAGVVSTDPLVVASDVGDSAGDGSGISDFFSVDNRTGKLRARISAPGERYGARCDIITKIEKCSGVVVGNDRLYIATEEGESQGKYGRSNEVVAFDLGTGKETGQRADAGDGYVISPLRMDGGDLLAYKRPPYDKGGQVVSIDGGSFEETRLMENPATESVRDAETRMLPEYAEILFTDGRLYMSGVYASDASSTRKEYLALAFGTG